MGHGLRKTPSDAENATLLWSFTPSDATPRNYEAHARYIQRTFFKKEREEKKNKSIFRANASKMYMKARHRQGKWRKKAGVAKSIHLLRMWFCSKGSKWPNSELVLPSRLGFCDQSRVELGWRGLWRRYDHWICLMLVKLSSQGTFPTNLFLYSFAKSLAFRYAVIVHEWWRMLECWHRQTSIGGQDLVLACVARPSWPGIRDMI